MSENQGRSCPFCGSELEIGCLLGNIPNLALSEYGLQWFSGEPTWSMNLLQLGDPIGKFEVGKGSYAVGARCTKCRKITLDY